jgi:hypothetical protein
MIALIGSIVFSKLRYIIVEKYIIYAFHLFNKGEVKK